MLKIDSKAKSVLLVTASGALTQYNTILRYLGNVSKFAPLNGSSLFETAEVNQWLEFSWAELETPLQTLLALKSTNPDSPAFGIDVAIKGKIVDKATKDAENALLVLESHLSSRTFIVGERITLADVTVYGAFELLQDVSTIDITKFVSVHRWYLTVGFTPKVSAVFPLTKAILLKSGISEESSGAIDGFAETKKTSTLSDNHIVGSSLLLTSKWSRGRIRIKEIYAAQNEYLNKVITVKGWVRTLRSQKHNIFVDLSDGSTVRGLQLVLDSTVPGYKEVENCGGSGASLSLEGTLVPSPKGDSVELLVSHATVLGTVADPKEYPMSKKGHSAEFLREVAHLRPRTKVFSSAMRLRNAMAYATHKFFNERGFIYTHTPIITAADCEGAGEQFAVTALLREGIAAKDLPVDAKGQIDYSKDYFGKRTCLTVSGQLNVETHACALSDVYTFGPTFRAEDSYTSRHLAEFWMIEPEICFADLEVNMALAEDYVKYCTHYALTECPDDIHYFEHDYPEGEKGLADRLRNVLENDFARITYTDAITLLHSEIAAGNIKFELRPEWGDDLKSEHERYLAEKIYRRPTIVTNYPKGIKAFYMKLNDDKKTVAAMDILVPKIGELIGGSQREDNFDVLEQRCRESGLDPKHIWWYSDLRRYGTVPHSGFGLGFERLIMFVTGISNIRDVIPFPRVPKHAEF